MKESHKRLFELTAEMAEEGQLGDAIKKARQEYRQVPAGIAVFIKCVNDAYEGKKGIDDSLFRMRDLFTQLFIATYRDAAQIDQQVALALVHSLISDYPNVPESCLAPQFCSLVQAAIAFREVAGNSQRSLIWQQTTRLVLSYNEFLNALFGFVIPCLRIINRRTVDHRVFSMPFQSRADQIRSLTGGEKGAFYLLNRLAKPRIRNAIAHGTLWPDFKKAKVIYTEGGRERRKYDMDLIDFGALALSGSHIAEPYLAAIGTIAIMEDGSDLAKELLPNHLTKVFRFRN